MNNMDNKFLTPLNEMINLNLSTFQDLSYAMTQEMLINKSPDRMLEKNMKILIEHGHKTLDYMQNAFLIMEKTWFNLSNQAIDKSQEIKNKTLEETQKNINHTIKSVAHHTKSTSPSSHQHTVKTSRKRGKKTHNGANDNKLKDSDSMKTSSTDSSHK